MSDFAAIVAGWHDFFMLSGTASATLIGLLFVAITLRTDIRTGREDSFARMTTRQSFQSYLCVFLFSLYFLIPEPSPGSTAISVILTALIPALATIRSGLRYRESLNSAREAFIWQIVVPVACYAAAIIVGVGLIGNHDDGIYWFVPVIAFLLIIPTRNAWHMLIADEEASG